MFLIKIAQCEWFYYQFLVLLIQGVNMIL